MNGFTERRASGAGERPGRNDLVLTWEASAAMLPLVRRVVADILRHQERLARLQPERDRLERDRLQLAWADRARRYEIEEEITQVAGELRASRGELEVLGVALLDADEGLVGFPTIVNNRRAYFSWKPGEERLSFWNFAGDFHRRLVPANWTNAAKGKPDAPRRNRPKK
jgi:hypothetical protein